MTEADLDGVVEVARVSFPDHPEDRACFAERLHLHAGGCLSLVTAAGVVEGYIVAYPWKGVAAPALNSLIGALPDDPDRIYLHDLALKPSARGGGRTREAVEHIVRHARTLGFPLVGLVAVNDAVRFWEGQGFTVVDSPGIRAKLESYGPDARCMDRRV